MPTSAQAPAVPRLTYLRIKNYRALRDVEFRDLTPLTVLIGPNGSGKSTVLDALSFLGEAVSGDLRKAWNSRNGFQGIGTQGQEGNISFELGFIFKERYLLYSIEFCEGEKDSAVQANISHEKFEQILPVYQLVFEGVIQPNESNTNEKFSRWLKGRYTKKNGQIGELPMSAIYAFIGGMAGMRGFQRHPLTEAADYIRSFIVDYRHINLVGSNLKGYSDKGASPWLSSNGDDLPNVLYYLHGNHPKLLNKIIKKLSSWVPNFKGVVVEIASDKRILLRFKDDILEETLTAQYISSGTMRLMALLTLLYEPIQSMSIGIEEPENELPPQLLYLLAEELIKTTETRQLLVATHSPFLVDALQPEQVWILHRGADGYTHATRAADIPNVKELVEDGSPLGYLWSSNFFSVGNPLGPRSTSADAR